MTYVVSHLGIVASNNFLFILACDVYRSAQGIKSSNIVYNGNDFRNTDYYITSVEIIACNFWRTYRKQSDEPYHKNKAITLLKVERNCGTWLSIVCIAFVCKNNYCTIRFWWRLEWARLKSIINFLFWKRQPNRN